MKKEAATISDQPASCPLTGSSSIHKVMDLKDYSVTGEPFFLFENPEMGLRFTWPVPSADEISRFYESENYISHSDTRKGLINKLYGIARNYTLRFKRRLIVSASGRNSSELLDFGCGTGAFAELMQRSGWNVTGLEPDNEARVLAENINNLDVVKNLSEIDSESRFDVITLWHVLEHVHNPDETIAALKDKLKEGGTIFIAVPNHRSYDAEFYKNYWAAWDVPRHLYHFSPKSMHWLLNNNGLRVLKTERMWLDSFYVSLLSEKYQESGIAGYFRAFAKGFISNSKAFADKEKCSSLIYIAQKKNR